MSTSTEARLASHDRHIMHMSARIEEIFLDIQKGFKQNVEYQEKLEKEIADQFQDVNNRLNKIEAMLLDISQRLPS